MPFCRTPLVVLTLLAASSFTAAADAPTSAPAPLSMAGLSFTSKDKMESGNSPRGPVMANWKLTFKADTVRWRYSDVSENFKYTLTPEGKISATSAMRKGPALTAQYDAAKKELTWEGKIYTQD